MRTFTLIISSLILVACGGGSAGSQPPPPPPPPPVPAAPIVDVEVGLKQLIFGWETVSGATYYRLLENPDGHSGFTQVGDDIPAGTLSVALPISVHLHDFTNALYIVEACNATGCNGSTEAHAMEAALDAIGYLKASSSEAGDQFGRAIELSADGRTLAVVGRGRVYIFRFDGIAWSQQAILDPAGGAGGNVTLSTDGNVLALGAPGEDSAATGINGDESDDSAENSGAAYVFRFDGANWNQQAYIKASNTGQGDLFGTSIALSADGNALAVGAAGEDSNATGVGGDEADNSAGDAGAVYVFHYDGANWMQQAYVKASNTGSNAILGDQFGRSVALNADGDALAIGASREDSSANGINGDQNDNSAQDAGAVYYFRFDGTDWSQHSYIKPSGQVQGSSLFGRTVALSADGSTLAVAGRTEPPSGYGGIVYLFRFDGTIWAEQASIEASTKYLNDDTGDAFGASVELNMDGNILAVGDPADSCFATGVNDTPVDCRDPVDSERGASFIFQFRGNGWSQFSYIKAPNTDIGDNFGQVVSLSVDGTALAVGAPGEESSADGIGGDQDDDSAEDAGAAFLY